MCSPEGIIGHQLLLTQMLWILFPYTVFPAFVPRLCFDLSRSAGLSLFRNGFRFSEVAATQ